MTANNSMVTNNGLNCESVAARECVADDVCDDGAWVSTSVEDTQRMAHLLAPLLVFGDCIELTGDLGAGKTHFTQGLAVGLSIKDQVISPTFNLLLTYEGGRLPLFHFDLYRLDDELELEDIGFYDACEDAGVVCIEWGEKFPAAMPEDRLVVRICAGDVCADASLRMVQLEAYGSRAQALRDAWEAALSLEFERRALHA